MNREDIIRMAQEAGLVDWLPNSNFSDGIWWIDAHEVGSELEAFAALVASAEREACAKVCEDQADDGTEGEWDGCCLSLAKQIRARGQA